MVRLFSVEGVPVKEQRLSRVLLRIVPAVNSWIQARGVRVLCLRQEVVENLLAAIEAVFVLGAAVEVDLHVLQLRRVFGEFQGVVGIPVRKVQLPAGAEANSVDAIEERLELIEPASRNRGGVEVR